jgi:hypothetical protein
MKISVLTFWGTINAASEVATEHKQVLKTDFGFVYKLPRLRSTEPSC